MGERASNEMEKLSLQTNTRFSRDLLHRFTVDPEEELSSGSVEEVELNLGLSLGGRFGVDRSNTKLVRSSSIAAILPVVRDDDVLGSGHENPNSGPGRGPSYAGLTRTSSLPVETEEEWRKRKELQSLRRLAAKRRRSEKQRSLTKGEREEAMSRPFRSNKCPPGGGTGTSKGGGGELSSERSLSEFEGGHRLQGSSDKGGETSSLLQESSSGSNPPFGLEVNRESSTHGKARKEIGSSCAMEDMPCVFTQGDGPNGRVVEGILYKYGKGEQVKIMCVCHGSFLSPAEFVKHAGGTDFLHPLKHIVVKPGSSFS